MESNVHSPMQCVAAFKLKQEACAKGPSARCDASTQAYTKACAAASPRASTDATLSYDLTQIIVQNMFSSPVHVQLGVGTSSAGYIGAGPPAVLGRGSSFMYQLLGALPPMGMVITALPPAAATKVAVPVASSFPIRAGTRNASSYPRATFNEAISYNHKMAVAFTIASQGSTGYVTIAPGRADPLVTSSAPPVTDPVLRSAAPFFVHRGTALYTNKVIMPPIVRKAGVRTSVPLDLSRPGIYVNASTALNPPNLQFSLSQPYMHDF